MADRRRGEIKQIKKDQSVRRETLDEIGSEITQNRTEALYRNPNRTGRRTDEERSRDAGLDGDEGLGPASKR